MCPAAVAWRFFSRQRANATSPTVPSTMAAALATCWFVLRMLQRYPILEVHDQAREDRIGVDDAIRKQDRRSTGSTKSRPPED